MTGRAGQIFAGILACGALLILVLNIAAEQLLGAAFAGMSVCCSSALFWAEGRRARRSS